jgi:hypothetical protein
MDIAGMSRLCAYHTHDVWSGRITPELVAMLGDKNWKLRGEGLEQVTTLLKEAKGRIQSSIGDLATPLYERLDDSNKNLVSITLTILCLSARLSFAVCNIEQPPLLSLWAMRSRSTSQRICLVFCRILPTQRLNSDYVVQLSLQGNRTLCAPQLLALSHRLSRRVVWPLCSSRFVSSALLDDC